MKKVIGFNIPCYNEEDNVIELCERIISLFSNELKDYDYLIQFIDNNSIDSTQEKLKYLCEKYSKVRAIFNVKNYRFTSAMYGLKVAEGDCVITIAADFEEPVETIPEFVKKWAEGNKMVLGTRRKSNENRIKLLFRKLYYKILDKCSDSTFINGFSGFGLYDRDILEEFKLRDDGGIAFRILIIQLGYSICTVEYDKKTRTRGKSKHSLISLLDDFFVTFVSSSTVAIRVILFMGFIMSVLSFLFAIAFLIMKLIFWDQYVAGMVPLLIGFSLIGSIQLLALGIIGEYVLLLNRRMQNIPYAIEKCRINFPNNIKGDKQ